MDLQRLSWCSGKNEAQAWKLNPTPPWKRSGKKQEDRGTHTETQSVPALVGSLSSTQARSISGRLRLSIIFEWRLLCETVRNGIAFLGLCGIWSMTRGHGLPSESLSGGCMKFETCVARHYHQRQRRHEPPTCLAVVLLDLLPWFLLHWFYLTYCLGSCCLGSTWLIALVLTALALLGLLPWCLLPWFYLACCLG